LTTVVIEKTTVAATIDERFTDCLHGEGPSSGAERALFLRHDDVRAALSTERSVDGNPDRDRRAPVSCRGSVLITCFL
jgi:hypothetical protein